MCKYLHNVDQGDELQCEARRYLRTALTAVLETEMIEAYGINLW